jgi:NitT/TauT family transport system substrate-binding protein
VLASGDVDAIVAWQPSSGQALAQVPGSIAVSTSKDAPGLIYDVLAVSPSSLASRKADWEKVAKVWYKAVDYIYDQETQADALSILAARVGLTADEYKPLLDGTKILTLEEAQAAMKKGEGMDSLYGSTKIADDFNVKYEVYAEPQAVDSYIDPSIILGM